MCGLPKIQEYPPPPPKKKSLSSWIKVLFIGNLVGAGTVHVKPIFSWVSTLELLFAVYAYCGLTPSNHTFWTYNCSESLSGTNQGKLWIMPIEKILGWISLRQWSPKPGRMRNHTLFNIFLKDQKNIIYYIRNVVFYVCRITVTACSMYELEPHISGLRCRSFVVE